MTSLLSSQEFGNFFNQEFPKMKVEYRVINLGNSNAYAFFIACESEVILRNNWIKIRNYIATKFQTHISDEFGKWNIYLFFILEQEISLELKYKIENDVFSSRKIIIENGDSFERIISNHILNSLDFGNDGTRPQEQIFVPNKIIYDELTDIQLKGKRKVTMDIKAAFEMIVQKNKSLNDENKES